MRAITGLAGELATIGLVGAVLCGLMVPWWTSGPGTPLSVPAIHKDCEVCADTGHRAPRWSKYARAVAGPSIFRGADEPASGERSVPGGRVAVAPEVPTRACHDIATSAY